MKLVKAYMSLDDTTLPPDVVPIVHGAGENFPIEQQGGAQPVDERAAQWNRRVELYIFDGTLGPQPSPPGLNSAPGSGAYPEWVRRASETHDFEVLRKEILELRLHDDDIHPWPHVYARADMGGEPQYLQADESGWVAIALPAACPERITVRWGAATPAASHPFERDVFVRCSEGSDAYQAEARLHNVGYDRRLDLEAAARCFQVDYGVDHEPEPLGLVNGMLPPATRERLDTIFAELECDATAAPQ